MNQPRVGTLWKHHKRGNYHVIAVAYGGDGEAQVVHKGDKCGQFFVRSLSNFMGVIPETMHPRFVEVV